MSNLKPVLNFFTVLALLPSLAQALPACNDYLKKDAQGASYGVTRVESLLGQQTKILDVSDLVKERRSKEDPKLRIINLTDIFSEGRVFVGFGRPNVYIGIPNVEDIGLGYAKVSAKSLKRADTKVEKTLDRVQSGLLMVFNDLPEGAAEKLIAAAKAHEGTRQWTCVNANCRILSDAGFTLGGESLEDYYFPVPLLKDIMQYGLEWNGQPVSYDLVKTTPGYLENIGLSINYATWTTLCRHTQKACSPLINNFKRNAYVVKINHAFKTKFGLALFNSNPTTPIEKPVYESQRTPVVISDEQKLDYDLEVSEPSQFGVLLRLLWGPHSLFEIPLNKNLVDSKLPNTLNAFPDENPSFTTRLKKTVLFNKGVVSLVRSQMSQTYRKIEDLTHNQLFDMLRTDSNELPNKYNYVVLGDRLIIMKISIHNQIADWILSKHVLLSSYSKDLRFAGELWKSQDGVIHINNNSGTYKPNSSEVKAATELFELLFPGVAIEGHEMGAPVASEAI